MKKYRHLACPMFWLVLFLLAGCSLIEPSPGHEVVTAATATQRSVAYPPPVGTPYPPPPTPVDTPLPPVLSVMPLAGTGLTWYECEGAEGREFFEQECENVLGFSLKEEDLESKLAYGENVTTKGSFYWRIRLKIGRDVYELIDPPRSHVYVIPTYGPGLTEYRLEKNGELLSMLIVPSGTTPSMLDIASKYALEFWLDEDHTIIYDGIDLREAYNLDGAAMPWELNGKLIFIGEKDERFFVMYDGEQIGADFSQIFIRFCCIPEFYYVQVERANGQYWFKGEREGSYRVVVIKEDR